MALTMTSVSWGALTIAGPSTGAAYMLRDLAGWEATPNITFESLRASTGYGSTPTPGSSDPRVVSVSGWCYSTSRDALLASLWSACIPAVGSSGTAPLTVAHAGLTLSADAQLIKVDASPEPGWTNGRFNFILQWRCPDPLRYGQQLLVSAPITPAPGGVSYPLSYPVVYPAGSPSGALVLTNAGNAPAPVVFSVQGPVTGPGLVNVTTGKQVTYGFDLVAGDVLTVDSRAGAAFLNGVYRAPLPGSARVGELVLPVGVSTVQAMGTAPSGTPSVSASYRPTYW